MHLTIAYFHATLLMYDNLQIYTKNSGVNASVVVLTVSDKGCQTTAKEKGGGIMPSLLE